MQMCTISPNIVNQLWVKTCIQNCVKKVKRQILATLVETKAGKGKCVFEWLREQNLQCLLYTQIFLNKKENQSEKVQRAK